MHPNPIFHTASDLENLELARDRAFGMLSVNGPDGPLASHVPFILSKDATVAELHLVRSNPIARALSEPLSALIAVTGPDSYVSPDWYGIDDQVPTWNYLAIHLRGRLERRPDSELPALLERQSAVYEGRLLPKTPWRLDKMSAGARAKLFRMIVPCRMTVERIDGTWKFSQNKPGEARESAANGVEADGFGSETRALARFMRGA